MQRTQFQRCHESRDDETTFVYLKQYFLILRVTSWSARLLVFCWGRKSDRKQQTYCIARDIWLILTGFDTFFSCELCFRRLAATVVPALCPL
jgi:hypothetical protein